MNEKRRERRDSPCLVAIDGALLVPRLRRILVPGIVRLGDAIVVVIVIDLHRELRLKLIEMRNRLKRLK